MYGPAGFALLETQWQDTPQLWVQTPRIDFTLADRVSGLVLQQRFEMYGPAGVMRLPGAGLAAASPV